MNRRSWVLVCAGALLVAAAIVLAWPPADPLAGVQTVALRGTSEPATAPIDVETELKVVLNHRDVRIIADEQSADVVLAITHARFDFGNLQLELAGGKLTGRATAVCRVVDVKTKRAYVMDLIVTLRNGEVSARLVSRRFWEFWKPRPSL